MNFLGGEFFYRPTRRAGPQQQCLFSGGEGPRELYDSDTYHREGLCLEGLIPANSQVGRRRTPMSEGTNNQQVSHRGTESNGLLVLQKPRALTDIKRSFHRNCSAETFIPATGSVEKPLGLLFAESLSGSKIFGWLWREEGPFRFATIPAMPRPRGNRCVWPFSSDLTLRRIG